MSMIALIFSLLLFACSPSVASQLAASFPGGGIWAYKVNDPSGTWQGSWESDEGPDTGSFNLQLTVTGSYNTVSSSSTTFTSAECGDVIGLPLSGEYDLNSGFTLNGHYYCRGTRLSLEIQLHSVSWSSIYGTYMTLAGNLPWDQGNIHLRRTTPVMATQMTPSTPENMISYGSSIIAEFGAGGIWMCDTMFSPHYSWSMLTPSNPENMVSSPPYIYAEFGAGGIYKHYTNGWTMITPSNPENMVAGSNGRLYAEFGAGGIWVYNGTSWTMLTPSNPENMVVDGSTLYAEFGAGGIWRWNGSSWTRISDANPESMIARGSILYADFGAGGLYMWNGSAWRMIANANPENMIVPDGNFGLIADFGEGGLYRWDPFINLWRLLTYSNPESTLNATAYNYTTLFSDFGPGGLYAYDWLSWTMITPSNPSMITVTDY